MDIPKLENWLRDCEYRHDLLDDISLFVVSKTYTNVTGRYIKDSKPDDISKKIEDTLSYIHKDYGRKFYSVLNNYYLNVKNEIEKDIK